MKLLQYGNSKLQNMITFNIPARIDICGRACKGCYSYKAYKIYPNVLPAQEARYQASLLPNFVELITKELKALRKQYKYIRWHASAGEFYSQEYVAKVYTIAKTHPQYVFYAYTKRLADFDFSALRNLPNFVLIDSLHFGSINYGTAAPVNAFVCPATQKAARSLTKCGQTCTWCMTKQAQQQSVYFYKH